MKHLSTVIILISTICTLLSCAGNSGLCRQYRTETAINSSRVPAELRSLIPLALKWGAGDPAMRDEMERSITAEEWSELCDSLHGRAGDIEQWLKTAHETGHWSAERCAFRFMLEFYHDMQDLQLMKALRK